MNGVKQGRCQAGDQFGFLLCDWVRSFVKLRVVVLIELINSN